MSMMGKMRTGINSGGMQVVLVLIIVTFVFWGVGGDNDTNSIVARVNGKRITDTRLNAEMRFVRGTQGDTQTQDEFDQRRVMVLSNLMNREMMLQEAAAQGIAVSLNEINQLTQEFPCPLTVSPVAALLGPNTASQSCEPWFNNEAGEFSQSLFENVIVRFGLDKARWDQRMNDELMRSKLIDLVARTVQVTDQQVDDRFVEENTSLSLEWVYLNPADLSSTMAVSTEELEARVASPGVQAAYEAEIVDRYTYEGQGEISIITMRAGIDNESGVTDEEIEAALNQVRDTLTGLSGEELKTAFASAATQHSDDLSAGEGGSRGIRTEAQMGPEIYEAAVEAGVGTVTPVVRTNTDFRFALVETLDEAHITPFEDVSATIARELIQNERIGTHTSELAEALLAQWSENGELDMELLAASDLELSEISSTNLATLSLGQIDPATEILIAARFAEAGEVLNRVFTVSGASIIVRVVSIEQPDSDLFEAQRELIRMRILNEEVNSTIINWQDDLQSRTEMVSHIN